MNESSASAPRGVGAGDAGVEGHPDGGCVTFADRLCASIQATNSVLLAGCDPVLENLPPFLLTQARATASTDAAVLEHALSSFTELFLEAVSGRVAAIKPNIAFFEQYGVAGVGVFERFCRAVRARRIPLIADVKRGDIGSTAAAYSAAFLGQARVGAGFIRAYETDAITVNPFLGFDTLEPFMADCERYHKGVFVLVQTSNPGAAALQGLQADGMTVSEHLAQWVQQNGARLAGKSGWSGLGAVVGATYPEQARRLRALMPSAFFLIPGFGAQGSGATDALAGIGMRDGKPGGAIVNVSRGLLEGAAHSADELCAVIRANVERCNAALGAALAAVQAAPQAPARAVAS